MPPATGSIRTYSVTYSNVEMVPMLGGRFGMTSQSGMGVSEGVLVNYKIFRRLGHLVVKVQKALTSKKEVIKIAGTQAMCIALLTYKGILSAEKVSLGLKCLI